MGFKIISKFSEKYTFYGIQEVSNKIGSFRLFWRYGDFMKRAVCNINVHTTRTKNVFRFSDLGDQHIRKLVYFYNYPEPLVLSEIIFYQVSSKNVHTARIVCLAF